MANPDSSIRSAARATSSAYKRLPIRWRLAGGSAALTLVILLGFATIVGVLTTRRIQSDFNRQVEEAADQLASRPTSASWLGKNGGPAARATAARTSTTTRPPRTPSSASSTGGQRGHQVLARRALLRPAARAATSEFARLPRRVAADPGRAVRRRRLYVQYARRLSDVQATANRVRFFLGLGVLGGAALALLAGLATARRAMAPDRRADRDRAHDRAHPRPVAPDPAPGGRGRGRRARAHARGDAARARRSARRDRGDAGAPARVRRRRLARAAHAADLRAGQPRAARGGARGRAARGRRLGPALLAPHAPARRRPAAARARRRGPHHPPRAASTSPSVLTEAAGELEPVADEHDLTVVGARRARRLRRPRRAAPPRAEPDGERAPPHRPGHARSRASVERDNGQVVLVRRGRRARASRRSCTTRSSSASSAAPATPRVVRPRPRDRARGGRIARRQRHARGPTGRARGPLRRALSRRETQDGARDAP